MKNLKTIILIISAGIVTLAFSYPFNSVTPQMPETSASQAIPVEVKWHNKLEEAQIESKKTNKPIFAFFTGSDWCGWCKRLQATVFLKPSFKQWANENVVLLELDFPRRKQLAPEIAAQNNQLKNFFKPAGYPTIWLFDMNLNKEGNQYEITALGNLGYPSGSKPGEEDQKFITNANKIIANRK